MKLLCTRGARREYRDPGSGEEYFSASQLLKVLEPDLFQGVHHQTLELARQRGVDLHRYFFFALAHHTGHEKDRPADVAPEWAGYQEAIWKFLAEWQPEPLLLEEASRDRKRGIAGRPDAKLRLPIERGSIRLKITLVDLKTGSLDRLHAVQANIYRRFEEYDDVQAMRTLYIRADGTYSFPPIYRDPMHEAAIDNAIQILRWRELAA